MIDFDKAVFDSRYEAAVGDDGRGCECYECGEKFYDDELESFQGEDYCESCHRMVVVEAVDAKFTDMAWKRPEAYRQLMEYFFADADAIGYVEAAERAGVEV